MSVGDAGEEFEVWYEREHPRLVAALMLATGDADLARDAVDEACLRVLMRWSRVSRMASPGGYAYRIALHEAWRRQRRARVEQRLLRRVAPEPVMPAPAGEAWDLVRDLPPRQRTAIVLRYVADLSEAEIADAMRVTRGTVSSTLVDARRAIAQRLDDEQKDSGDRHG
jgi:RNA polymerase sigma-70 factor (ECF subfamily)